MKKYVFLVFVAFACINTLIAQDLQNEQLKTNLNSYETLCKLIVEHIEAIKNSSGNLTDKTKESEKVANLVKQINKDISNLYDKTKNLDNRIKALSDSLQTASPKLAPKEGKRDMQEQPPVEKVREPKETIVQPVEGAREPRESQEVAKPVPVPVNKRDNIEQYLLSFSLNDLCKEGQRGLEKKGSDIKSRLHANGDRELYNAYATILELFNVQYIIYSRNEVKDVLQRASAIRKDLLVGYHYDELQSEIAHVKEYRYATMELQRLIKIVANPSDAIKKELGYDNSGAGDSKWADSEDIEIPSSEIRDYLINKNETEYISKFEYTKKKFDDFVNHPEQRKAILAEIDYALK